MADLLELIQHIGDAKRLCEDIIDFDYEVREITGTLDEVEDFIREYMAGTSTHSEPDTKVRTSVSTYNPFTSQPIERFLDTYSDKYFTSGPLSGIIADLKTIAHLLDTKKLDIAAPWIDKVVSAITNLDRCTIQNTHIDDLQAVKEHLLRVKQTIM